MIYELRIYRAVPGRLPDVIARFKDHILPLWDKHGIRQAGFWTTLVGASNQQLTYFLAWESLAEREKSWSAFLADPAWIAVVKETEKNGPIVENIASELLSPTSFSSVK
ncbi:MAG TPA: NIPSNAP family protein [Rhizomicrobium sp.]|nr:NIPSNAP family protein [Rhizomicrobium sp.]